MDKPITAEMVLRLGGIYMGSIYKVRPVSESDKLITTDMVLRDGDIEGSKDGPGSESDKSIVTVEKVLRLAGGATVLGSLAGAGVSIATPNFILPVIGFGITGITKGSIAALIHSLIGNVTAGSFFALMQSAGAVGAISWTTFAGITFLGSGATVVIAVAVYYWYRWSAR